MFTLYKDLIQGSDEWLQARCGLLTASEMKLIVTNTFKPASNDKERAHLYELMAQRITGYVEPSYVGDDQIRGWEDEIRAKELYSSKYAPVDEIGFITNDKFGFTIGYSPDGLVGDDGLIEVKSRRQKFQAETIINDSVPDEFMVQIQTGLLVSGREWCDFISYCGGMPMFVKRVYPDIDKQSAIVNAAVDFENRLAEKLSMYKSNAVQFYQTEREVEKEIIV